MQKSMGNDKSENSYTFYAVIIAGSFNSIGACLLIFLFFCLLALSFSEHHSESVPTITNFLVAAIWCLASYFLASVIVFFIKDFLRKYIPSWIVVSAFGSLIFTLSFWTFAYINSVKDYQPDSPFSSTPQQFSQVI
jgi:hypothetical protein